MNLDIWPQHFVAECEYSFILTARICSWQIGSNNMMQLCQHGSGPSVFVDLCTLECALIFLSFKLSYWRNWQFSQLRVLVPSVVTRMSFFPINIYIFFLFRWGGFLPYLPASMMISLCLRIKPLTGSITGLNVFYPSKCNLDFTTLYWFFKAFLGNLLKLEERTPFQIHEKINM